MKKTILFGALAMLLSTSVLAQESPYRSIISVSEVKGAAAMQLKTLDTQRPVRVIFSLSEGAIKGQPSSSAMGPASLDSAPSDIQAAQKKLKERLKNQGVKHIDELGTLPFMVAELNAVQLESLVSQGEVSHVYEDTLSSPQLAISVPMLGGAVSHFRGLKGDGTTIAILDTGVQSDHPFLSGRVVEEACFSSTSSTHNSTSLCPGGVGSSTAPGSAAPCTNIYGCAHGTHVAGIAAGRASGSIAFNGMAPNAKIFAIQVFSKHVDSGTVNPCQRNNQNSPCLLSFASDQMRALSRIRDRRAALNIVAANISISDDPTNYTSPCNVSQAPIINELFNLGVATVVASGNSGWRGGVTSPGCVQNAVTVAATTAGDEVWVSSNVSTLVDILAPGDGITSSVLNSGFDTYSGTSMAAPHVAGAIALLRQYNPTATVNQMVGALQDGGIQIPVPFISPALTLSRVSVLAAQQGIGGAMRHGAGLCIHPQGGGLNPADGTIAILSSGCTEERLKYRLLSNGSIKHLTSGKCLRPQNSSTNPANNTRLVFASGCNHASGQFEFTSAGSLRHKTSGKCIHPAAGGSATPPAGTQLIFWDSCNLERLRITHLIN